MPLIGVVQPTETFGEGVNALIPGSPIKRAQTVVLGKDAVWLHSDTPVIDLVCRLNGKPGLALPKPRYDQVDRPGTSSLNRYRGHDPRTMPVPLLIDRGGRSIKADIVTLEQLAERTNDTAEPPVLKVQGIGVQHAGRNWRLTLPDDPADVQYNLAGDPSRLAITVTLVEHTTDKLLAQTLTGGPGVRGTRLVRTRAGDTLYDLARRYYGDPSRASDIQKANPWARFGQVFRAGRKLYIP